MLKRRVTSARGRAFWLVATGSQIRGLEEDTCMNSIFNRRQALALGAGAVAVALSGTAGPAMASEYEELIKKFTGGKAPAPGRVKLDLPEIAENGNTVPMTVSVESPMTAQSHVTDVLVVADGNPHAAVVTFHFSPASGVAEANTRIRLAKTQNVIAVAKMNDGSFFTASKQVKVTIGGCGG
jgi:sulfur-oxidizing protein SoxY